jgi:predicted DCC family thiol-disulfide oxidoreductase YuxK
MKAGSNRMPMPEPSHSPSRVIVFDGDCLLCSGWVDFLLRHDRRRRYRFAAMQGRAGRELLAAHGLDPQDPTTFLLFDPPRARTDSDAVIAVLEGLGGFWRTTTVLRAIPNAWRDAGYRWLARNRYRWFGKRTSCYLPAAGDRERFLDDTAS